MTDCTADVQGIAIFFRGGSPGSRRPWAEDEQRDLVQILTAEWLDRVAEYAAQRSAEG